MTCLMRVVARSWTGTATACLTWTVPTTVSSASSTGKREWPVWRARSMTEETRSPSSTVVVRTRGVMISPAVRVPNSTERSTSSAVSASRVPWSAERCTSEASSCELRAERSSSCGSMPRRRTIALAEPLRARIGPLLSAVKPRMKPCVVRAVSSGRAMAMFLGTISPKIIVTTVPSGQADRRATAGVTTPSGTPAAASGPSMRSEIAGSARKPIARLVTVMPTWAPESWVDSERSASWTPRAPSSPSAAARSTLGRSTVTRENSAATKRPQAATRASETSSRRRGVTTRTRCSVRSCGDFDCRPWRCWGFLCLGRSRGAAKPQSTGRRPLWPHSSCRFGKRAPPATYS